MERLKVIMRTSIIGIVVNILLVIFKMIIGLIANSIAIILDAVNNLSDALSSIITIIGTKLSSKKPDKEHPYGHGRIEYLTSVIVSEIIIVAGLTSIKESVEKIINPMDTHYTNISIIVIIIAIIAKLIMGNYVQKKGKKINSQALVASGSDALFDAILSIGTLISALLNIGWNLNIEGYIGAIISIFIIKAGIEMLSETLNSIIGTRVNPELSKKLKEKVNSFEDVIGAYDLILHNYGPTKTIGGINIEVRDTMTAKEIHKLTRKIVTQVFDEFGIMLRVGIYASNKDFSEIKSTIDKIIKKHDEILQLHGFYVDSENKNITFDLVIDFNADSDEVRRQVIEELSKIYEEYSFDIIIDSDFSD